MKREMDITFKSTYRSALFIFAFLLTVGSVTAEAKYLVGPGDVLSVRYWQQPDLNSEAQVALDGTITLDVVGQMDVAGKTTEEIQSSIARRITNLVPGVSQASVTVTAYNYQYVYVTGQVANPGKYSWEEIPGLWSVINEAGGPGPSADLTQVTIIRGGGSDAGKVEVVNVARAIAAGELGSLPELRRQDRIDIPQTIMGIPSQELGRSTEQRNVVYVMGAVNSPGPMTFQDDMDILEAIALAGGPSASADIKKTRVVTKDGFYGQSLHFNLEKYTSTGSPHRYILNKEDAIYIPERRSTFMSTTLPILGGAAGLITTFLLIYNQIDGNNNN